MDIYIETREWSTVVSGDTSFYKHLAYALIKVRYYSFTQKVLIKVKF